ncbi:MAG TPA: cytochrome C oxidase subunit IV family protein [Candidatus Saccharimonadales bacterium]|nr:cytochrome C oxidase subunit IV family protein [Candidatus Saccharimonadales bacterium]
MNEQSEAVVIEHPHEALSFPKYVIGFVLSIGLTLVAYHFATGQGHSKLFLTGVLASLAIVQFVVQMVLFLHVGSERKPRWKLAVMWLMLAVVLILVGGSIWIMNNLNTRMTPQQVQRYLKSQDAL